MLELLAPSLPGVVTGGSLSIRDPADRIRVINTARLRARLLEFLKFRVLASQDLFFQNTEGNHRREWLGACYPEALDLGDQDLIRSGYRRSLCTLKIEVVPGCK